jgi:hypothetical protein
MIDKIKGLGSNFESKKVNSTQKTTSKVGSDNIEISEAAKLKSSELKFQAEVKSIAIQVLASESLTGPAKIQEIRDKLKSGFYDNLSEEVLHATADRLLETLVPEPRAKKV